MVLRATMSTRILDVRRAMTSDTLKVGALGLHPMRPQEPSHYLWWMTRWWRQQVHACLTLEVTVWGNKR